MKRPAPTTIVRRTTPPHAPYQSKVVTPVPIRSTDELIPGAVDGQDVYWPVWLGFDLASQLDDEVVNRSVVRAGFEAPNLFEDLVS
jgi:hypothetical protein